MRMNSREVACSTWNACTRSGCWAKVFRSVKQINRPGILAFFPMRYRFGLSDLIE
jgi:hypothetical protein